MQDERILSELSAMRAEITRISSEISIICGLLGNLVRQNVPNAGFAPDKVLDQYISNEQLSARTYNTLRRAEIKTIRDLTYLSEHNLGNIRNFGTACLKDLKAYLGQYSVELSQEFTGDRYETAAPKFHVGELAILRIADSSSDLAPGNIVTITAVRDGFSRKSGWWELTNYVCEDTNGKVLVVSPGMIAKINECNGENNG